MTLGVTRSSLESSGRHTHKVTGTITSEFTGNSVTTESNNKIPTATFKGTNTITSSVGNGQAFSVRDPYITVYMWKRIE